MDHKTFYSKIFSTVFFPICVSGRPFMTLDLHRGEGLALFGDLLKSYVLDIGWEGSNYGEELLTS